MAGTRATRVDVNLQRGEAEDVGLSEQSWQVCCWTGQGPQTGNLNKWASSGSGACSTTEKNDIISSPRKNKSHGKQKKSEENTSPGRGQWFATIRDR